LETITSRIGFSPVQARVVTFQRAEGSGTGAEVFALVAQADMQESANVQTFDARSFCPELRLPSRVVTAQGHEFSFFAEQRRVFSPDRAEPSFGMDSIGLLWRVGLLIAACLSIAAATANAAPLSRAGCPDRDPALCALYRGAPVYSGQKFSRTHTHRTGGKSRSRPAPSATVGQAYSAAAPPSLPAAEAASATALAARFAPIAAGENAGQTHASSPAASPSPWLGPIWMALVGGGILSLFLARIAEL
jgi:hypothetical protein